VRRRGTELPWTLWARPVKPLALSLALASAAVVAANAADTGALGASPWGDVVAGMAAAVVVLLAGGWAGRSQRAAELGLLLGAGLWTGRAAAVAAVDGPGAWPVWTSLAWAVAAGGAYLLERAAADDAADPG